MDVQVHLAQSMLHDSQGRLSNFVTLSFTSSKFSLSVFCPFFCGVRDAFYLKEAASRGGFPDSGSSPVCVAREGHWIRITRSESRGRGRTMGAFGDYIRALSGTPGPAAPMRSLEIISL